MTQPNPDWRTPSDGEITGGGIVEGILFLERYNAQTKKPEYFYRINSERDLETMKRVLELNSVLQKSKC